MKVPRKYLYAAGAAIAAGAVAFLWSRSSAASSTNAVPGTVTSGSKTVVIDTNVCRQDVTSQAVDLLNAIVARIPH